MSSAVGREVWGSAGHAFSLDELFRSRYGTLLRIAAAVLRDRAEAEDVVQEVFLTLSRRAAGIRDPEAWLRRAAVNAALNRLRALRRRHVYESRAAGPEGGEPSPEAVVVAAERTREVRQALARLPARQAAVLVLRHSGLSYQEVALAAGVAPDQVGTVLRRAEKRLREAMSHDPS